MDFSSELEFLAQRGMEIMIKVGVALAAGLLLGYERQKRGKAVGVLTAMLVALGSMLFVEGGLILTRSWPAGGDNSRVAAAIVAGIGFIGAGAIMRSKFKVTGLTTAATVWCLGGIGALIGGGFALTAIGLTGVIFLALRYVPSLEHVLFRGGHCLHADIVLRPDTLNPVLEYLAENEVSTSGSRVAAGEGRTILSINECGMESKKWILRQLRQMEGVLEIINRSSL